jgi:hypothetical protein
LEIKSSFPKFIKVTAKDNKLIVDIEPSSNENVGTYKIEFESSIKSVKDEKKVLKNDHLLIVKINKKKIVQEVVEEEEEETETKEEEPIETAKVEEEEEEFVFEEEEEPEEPEDPSIGDAERKMREVKKKAAKEEKRKNDKVLKDAGFETDGGLAFFPGMEDKVKAAKKALNDLKSENGGWAPPPLKPKLKINPIGVNGIVPTVFNQEMIMPDSMEPEILKTVWSFKIKRDSDGQITEGTILDKEGLEKRQ